MDILLTAGFSHEAHYWQVRPTVKRAAMPQSRKLNSGLRGRYCFLAVEEVVMGFGCMTENCDTAPAGFAFTCLGFFFSRLLLS
jgi:hypothetical protein